MNLGVEFNPNKDGDSCVIKAYVDSDWEGDKTTRKSVSGWLIYLCDCIIGWGSRYQKTLELSSSSD